MKNRPYPFHPFQVAIEQAWDKGQTPRLLVLGDRPGVVLPQSVIKSHDGRPITIDLDPTYPMNPEFYDGSNGIGMRVTLAFSGHIQQCSFPWNAMLAVQNREDGSGFVRLVTEKKKEEAPAAPPKRGFSPRVIDGGKKESE